MNLFRFLFNRFRLPKPGDKVGFSDGMIKTGMRSDHCFIVEFASGDKTSNYIYLHCGTYLKAGEWKHLPKETPVKC